MELEPLEPNLARDGFTLEAAAKFLGDIRPENVCWAVVQYQLRCGILARGWKGWGLPVTNGRTVWKPGSPISVETDMMGDVRRKYRCIGMVHGEHVKTVTVDVEQSSAGQFWFLDEDQSSRLFESGEETIIRLILFNGKGLHAAFPEWYPQADFEFWIDSSSATRSRQITPQDVIFLKQDLDEFKNRVLKTDSISAQEIPTRGSGNKLVLPGRIEDISTAIEGFGWNPHGIPKGGKTKIKAQLVGSPGSDFSDSTFNKAWQAGLDAGKFRMITHDKYSPKA